MGTDERINSAKNRHLLKQLPYVLLINLPILVGLGWLYWDMVSHVYLLGWIVLMLIVLIMRASILLFYLQGIKGGDLSLWQKRFLTGNSAISGVMWGAAGVIFFVPNQLEYQLVIFCLLVFKGVGSASAISGNYHGFLFYLPTSMLPIAFCFFLSGEPTSLLLSLICMGFIFVMLVFGSNFNRTLEESLKLRFENENLLEQSQLAREKAEAASSAKSQFLAATTHDLKQPIYAIKLFIESMEGARRAKDSTRILEGIKGSVYSMETLLNTLLDASKMESGKAKINKKHFAIGSLIERLRSDFQSMAESKHLDLSVEFDPVWIYSDERLLEQILRNLVTNAIRYTHSGRVCLLVNSQGESVVFTVRDTGIGIEDKYKEKIFTEFYQIPNDAVRDGKGLGLGLSIVKRSIQLLNTDLVLKSKFGEGSEFSFSLPFGKPGAGEKIENDFQVAPQPELDLTVLLIEDESSVAEALQLLLKKWGCDTVHVADISQLMGLLDKHSAKSFDCVISDFQLPDGDGLEAIQIVKRQLNPSIPIIMTTGIVDSSVLELIRSEGFELLQKPVPPARLRSFLRSVSSWKID